MNLLKAADQWMNRPDDERFESITALERATLQYALLSQEETTVQHQMEAVVIDEDGKKDLGVKLIEANKLVKFSNSGFRQLSAKIGAPASYLTKLPHQLAVKNINHGIMSTANEKSVVLLTDSGENTFARSFTTSKYNRIWNHEIASRLGSLNNDWVVPPARPVRQDQAGSRIATKEDILRGRKFSLSIKEGDLIAPAGIYASDKDMFVFMVNEERGIETGDELLYRGFFVSNNEIGEGSLILTTFLYNTVCGNHIIWGAKGVNEFRIKHFGSANDKWNEAWKQVNDLSDVAASTDRTMIEKARNFSLGKNKEEVVDEIFSKRVAALGKRRIEKAFDTAVEYEHDHGDPTNLWGMVSGFTRISQETMYADERDTVDRAASKLMSLVS